MSFFSDAQDAPTEQGSPSVRANVAEMLMTVPFGGKYAVEIPGSKQTGYSPIYRAPANFETPDQPQDLVTAIPSRPDVVTLYGILEAAAQAYGDRLYIGERQVIRSQDPNVEDTLTSFKFYSYAGALKYAKEFGMGLEDAGVPESSFQYDNREFTHRIVGLWSRSRVAWRLADFALSMRGMVSVPLYDTLGEEALIYICGVTNMKVIILEGTKIEQARMLIKNGLKLTTVISIDPPKVEQVAEYEELGVKLLYMRDMKRAAAVAHSEFPVVNRGLDDVATIIYTSGTTGLPKGAVHTNGSLLSIVGGYLASNNRMDLKMDDSTLSYLPSAHIYQRGVELVLTFLGVKIGYFSGDLLKVTDDLQMLKPTLFVSVPRVLTKMLAKIKAGLAQKPKVIQWLATKALRYKLDNYTKSGAVRSFFTDMLFSKIRSVFGGNLRSFTMGSAPMDPVLLKELQLYLSVNVREGWGMTEVGISFLQEPTDVIKGTIGGPLACLEFRLASVADLQYDVEDDPPRGELQVRGPCCMREYFMSKEKTTEAVTKEGWLRTGDVVELLSSGAVRIVDRAKNIFKLAHGEYVAPERLEGVYAGSPFVDQIFVYGESLKASLVAVVVPNTVAVKEWAVREGKNDLEYDALLSDSTLIAAILSALEQIGRKVLKGFELIRAVYLTSIPFTVENSQLTPTMKVVRKAVSSAYSHQLKELYEKLAEAALA